MKYGIFLICLMGTFHVLTPMNRYKLREHLHELKQPDDFLHTSWIDEFTVEQVTVIGFLCCCTCTTLVSGYINGDLLNGCLCGFFSSWSSSLPILTCLKYRKNYLKDQRDAAYEEYLERIAQLGPEPLQEHIEYLKEHYLQDIIINKNE